MSFQSCLRIGSTLLFPQQVLSFSFMNGGLFVNSTLGALHLQGEGLHHCAIDLVNGLCTDIQPAEKAPLVALRWQVNSINPVKRMPPATTPVDPFEGIVPGGWLLFEMKEGWHFWPVKTLLAIAQARIALLFVYDSVTVEVQAPLPELETEFDRWEAGSITARHYTERNVADYSGILPVGRFTSTAITLRTCDPEHGLRGKHIKQWVSFSSALPEPPRKKTWDIER